MCEAGGCSIRDGYIIYSTTVVMMVVLVYRSYVDSGGGGGAIVILIRALRWFFRGGILVLDVGDF